MTWSAPVRYGETDQQGIVFNAHYLLYCDEALNAFGRERGLDGFADVVRLKSTTLTWQAPATWGDTVEVDVRCLKVGRTSIVLGFEITAAGRECCTVETVYVHTDPHGTPTPVPDDVRAALTATR